MDHTLHAPQVFPAGTTVGAYRKSNWPAGQLPPTAAVGAPEATAVVGSDGTLTFTGLSAVDYYAGATVNGIFRTVAFSPKQTGIPDLDLGIGDLGVVDLYGHSIAAGGGVAASLGVQDGFAWTLGRLLGVRRFRDLSASGSIACWPGNANTAGFGGWGWVLGSQALHGVAAGESGFVPPYLPARHGAIIMATQNDLAQLGHNKPLPMQHALRSLISWALTTAFIDQDNAAWTYAGTWAPSGVGGFGTGPTSTYTVTSTLNDTATLAVPADALGSNRVLAIGLFVNPTQDLTVGVTIDGVAQPDQRLIGSAVCDTEVATKHNTVTLRYPGLSAGAHTVVLTLKTQTVAASSLTVNDARIESDPADGPVVIVPSSIKPVGSDYSLWAAWPHGPAAGTDPINDAAVASWQAAERAVVDEFDDNVLYVDVDTALGQNAALFTSDHVHPNELGHAVLAETVHAAIRASGILTMRRRIRPAPLPGPAFTRVIGGPGAPALANGWAQQAIRPPLAYFMDMDGLIHIRGNIGGGSGSTLTICTMGVGCRPQYDTEFAGFTNAPAFCRWKLTTAGVLNIDSGGNTSRNVLPTVAYSPAN